MKGDFNTIVGTNRDERADNNDARVVCRMLGYSNNTALLVRSHNFGAGRGEILLDEVRCTGSEASLSDCGVGFHRCKHHGIAGVRCIP